jgi:hypothetical protein
MKWLVAMIGILAACGGEGGSNGSISIEELPAENGRVQCAKLDECCTLEEFMDETLGSETVMECEQLITAFTSILIPVMQDSVAKGRMVYHADRMADCFATLEGQTCAGFRRALEEGLGNCENPFEPQVADGGACGDDFDCTSEFCVGEEFDFETNEITLGVCGSAPGNGEPCIEGDCDGGLYCDGSTCATPQPDGALCTGDEECVSGECNNGSGTCGPIMTCDGK